MSQTPSESTELSRKSEAYEAAQLKDGEFNICYGLRCPRQVMLSNPMGGGSSTSCSITYQGKIEASKQRDLPLLAINLFSALSQNKDREQRVFNEYVEQQRSNMPAECPRYRHVTE